MYDQLPTPIDPSAAGASSPQEPPAAPAPSMPINDKTDSDKSASSSAHEDLPAADVDLIEKEWVVKAKKIVNSTQGDPYLQNKELNKVRAEYIKKRYNKSIKIDE